MRTFPIIVIATLVSVSAFASETPSIRELTDSEVEELMDGDTIRDLRRGNPLRAEVIGLIEAPLSELAPILIDYPNIPEWAPATADIEIVGSGDGCTYIEGTTRLPWPITDRTWRMCSRNQYDTVDGQDAFVYRFDYVQGTGNINESFGYWVLYPLANHPEWTYVRYVVNADPGIAIPPAILRWATGRALPDLIEGLRERHEELR